MNQAPENDCCSVCHEDFSLPCQANCSHWFCGSCILRVWHYGSVLHPCKCPICRQPITLLIPCETWCHHHHDTEAGQILENVEKYNRLFGGNSRSLFQMLRDLPFFLRRLIKELLDPQVSIPMVLKARMMFMMILTAAYVLSPIDIIPEGLMGIVGFLDDFLVILIVLMHIATVYRSVLLYRHGGY